MALSDDELRNAIAELLSGHTVMTLATVGGKKPHAVSLMYAYDERFDIYWLSDPETRHSRHLEHAAVCAVTIAGQHQDFRAIRGLQMIGTGALLADDEEANQRLALLTARYRFLEDFASGELTDQLDAAGIYRYRPSEITLIDNSLGFGFKQTLHVAAVAGSVPDGG